MLMYMFFMGFSFCMMKFLINRKHLLLMLLTLELIIILLYLNIYIYLSLIDNEFFFVMIFLTFSVCESVLGLSILILMVRLIGNDYILNFSSLW